MFGTSKLRFSRGIPFIPAIAALAVTSLFLCTARADQPPPHDGASLLAKYAAIAPKLQKNQFSAPIFLESTESKGTQEVDMYGVFDYPFQAVRAALESPQAWCDITSLHINVKACTAQRAEDHWLLTIYSGRKHYQPPSEAYPLKLDYRVAARQPGYLDITLNADHGPLRTRNHRIRLEAAPLDAGHTFLHFSYAYTHGAVANMAIKTYFATIARDKLGFSLVPAEAGSRVFVGGVRGAIERNTVRYYFALETYMDTLKFPESQRFEQRLARWYDLTSRYPRQLKELEKPEYLANKRREHANQVYLQQQVAVNGETVASPEPGTGRVREGVTARYAGRR